ncbi:MAG: glycosyl hydrolase, partial [Planctomycetota bacterium]|nr:glycosyl hydrolase [Planctomycetota bacterium]
LVSPHDPARVYFASQRVWRSDDRGDAWTPVSEDLTSGVNRLTAPLMGRVQSIDAVWDLWAMSKYATITSLAESPLVEGLLYAGTDDGHLQVSEDGGASWRATTSLPGVADGWFVNDIKADLHDADTAYACVDQHKTGDFAPYVFKTTDRAQTWTSIVGDLPERHIAWRIVQDHVRPELLFLGTEFGVFFTVDGGARWVELTGAAPNIPFRDLELQRRDNDLVCATFGRGIYILDDYAPLREVTDEVLAAEGHLFAVRDAHWYVERSPLGGDGPASQGDAYFVADNPPFGAAFTYYLRDGYETSKSARAAAEAAAIEAGEDTPTPGWDALDAEGRDSDPQIVFTVTDDAGNVVRRFAGPAQAGLQRVAWDLRYPSVSAWSEPVEREPWDAPDAGFLVMPGRYTVRMAVLREGGFTALGAAQSFEVTPLRDGALPRVSPTEMSAFHRRFEAINLDSEAVFEAVAVRQREVEAVREVLLRSREVHEAEFAAANDLRHALLDLGRRMHTDEARDFAGDPGPVALTARFFLLEGLKWSTHGPTAQQRDVLDLLEQDLEGIRSDYIDLEDRLETFYGVLDAKGVPWTPGRSVIRR